MTGLVSKWANDEPLSPKAETLSIKSVVQSPTKPANKLASKWANAPDLTSESKVKLQEPSHKASQKSQSSLPTPPASSGDDGSGVRPSNEGDYRRNGQSNRRRKSGGSGSRNVESKAHGRNLADRIGDMDITDTRDQKKTHARRGSKEFMSPKKTSTLTSNPGDESEEEFPTTPMTAAAKSFALRIGTPAKENDTSQHSSELRTGAHKPSQSSNREKLTPGKDGTVVTSKYMTPKQKRNHDAEERQAKLAKEQAIKEAKLKAEVQSMFDKMNDKSTSWADLEDESD